MQILTEYFNHIHPLPIPIQKRIEEGCTTIQFDRNDNIDIIGKTPEHFLLINSGIVKSIYRTSTATLITGFKGPGDALFHVGSLFHNAPAEEGFKVVKQTEAIAFPYKMIHDLHSHYPEFFIQLVKLVDIKLLDLQRHSQILSETKDRRICLFAQHFSHIVADVPKQQLARFLCISRTSLYFHGKPSKKRPVKCS